MAAPNIVNVATITGKTAQVAVTTASTTVLTNAAASGKVMKVNSLYIANIHASSAATVSITAYGSNITKDVSVPAASTLVAIDKESPLYLEEGETLAAQADITSGLVATVSYEEIS